MASIHQQLSGNQNRRMANEGRMLDRIEAQERAEARDAALNAQALAADPRIGTLCRKGQTVYYVINKHGHQVESKRAVDLLSNRVDGFED